MKKLAWLIAFWLLVMATNSFAATHYVRTDGGTGAQCTGLADAAYDGTFNGSAEPCAVNHPLWVLPHPGNSTTRAAVAGDTIVLQTGTSYRMGCQGTSDCKDATVNLTTSTEGCGSGNGAAKCESGIPPNNVKIIGCSTSGCGSSTRPILWGAGGGNVGGVGSVLRLNDSVGVTVSDIDITDHEQAGVSIFPCTTGVTNLCTNYGINQQGVSGLTLRNMIIHGMRVGGIFGGYIGSGGVIYDNLDVYTNPLVGIDFSNNCSTHNCGAATGTPMIFKNGWSVKYSGCVEEYPVSGTLGAADTVRAASCYEQNTGGGYGDGIANDSTSGNWSLTDGESSFNTSDGIDMLYTDGFGYSGTVVDVRRVKMQGNIGACFKSSSKLHFEDNICIADTQYWYGNSLAVGNGANFGYNRGNSALHFGYDYGTDRNAPIELINNTIMSNMAIMIQIQNVSGAVGSPNWTFKNNNFLGGYSFNDGQYTAFVYTYDEHNGTTSSFVGNPVISQTNNTCGTIMRSSTLAVPCTGTNDKNEASTSTISGTLPLGSAVGYNTTGYYTGVDAFSQVLLKSTSLSINNADETVLADSFDNNQYNRGSAWDVGALEFGTVSGGGSATCGNNITEGSEVCDGTDVNSTTCYLQGYSAQSGTVSCTTCTAYNTSACVARACGDGYLDASEACESGQLNGQTCTTQGYTTGTLACSASCTFDTSGCSNSGSGSFPSTGILDTFTGSNGPVSATNWYKLYGGTDSQVITNNTLAFVSGSFGENAISWLPKTDFTDTEVYATISTLPTNGASTLLFARTNQLFVDGYFVEWVYNSSGTDTINIKKNVSGVETQLTSQSFELTTGDKFGLKLVGSNIQLWKYTSGAWSLVTTVVDSSLTSGKIGVYMVDATERLDDFGGGTVVVGGTVTTTPNVVLNGRVVCGGRTVIQ